MRVPLLMLASGMRIESESPATISFRIGKLYDSGADPIGNDDKSHPHDSRIFSNNLALVFGYTISMPQPKTAIV